MEIAATLLANIIESLTLLLLAKADAKAPLKTSPAPVVSMTLLFNL